MNIGRIAVFRACKQGLLERSIDDSPATVLERTGWARSVGGANPYWQLFARSGATKDQAEREVASRAIHELPSARGCTYYVPSEHFAIALTVSQKFASSTTIASAIKHVGVTMSEIEALSDATLVALELGAADPKRLKDALGDKVRNLGEEGKKRGMTTTLPMVLGRLQGQGMIRRIAVDGRLDGERYEYALWPDGPLKSNPPTEEQAFKSLAKLFWKWTGPATLKHFQWFSGLGVAASKAAIHDLEFDKLDNDLLILSHERDEFESFKAPLEACYKLVTNIDSSLMLMRDLSTVIGDDPASIRQATDKGLATLGGIMELANHAILDRGRLIGLWEYDSEAKEIVWTTFEPTTEALKQEIKRCESFAETIGDVRSFSLDSPKSRQPRLALIRSLPQL